MQKIDDEGQNIFCRKPKKEKVMKIRIMINLKLIEK